MEESICVKEKSRIIPTCGHPGCNVSLGQAGENINRLLGLIEYIKSHAQN